MPQLMEKDCFRSLAWNSGAATAWIAAMYSPKQVQKPSAPHCLMPARYFSPKDAHSSGLSVVICCSSSASSSAGRMAAIARHMAVLITGIGRPMSG